MSKPSFSLHNNSRTSLFESIEPSTIEIVDLTGTSTLQPPRRPLDSPTSERPAKRSKGKGRERYISLDDDQDDDDQHEEQDLSTAKTDLRHKSPTQSGSLSQAKCVIC